jgi:hypothetical protein
MIKKILVTSCACLLLVIPPIIWFSTAPQNSTQEPVRVLSQYLKILYARDYRQAYGFISSTDRQLKTRDEYVREHGPFSGFALEVARKLAGAIEIKPISSLPDGTKERVKVSMKLPDANRVAPMLFDWDEKRLNRLPPTEQRRIIAGLDGLIRARKLPMVEGDDEFALVKEGTRWKIFLDWAAGARVQFDALLPSGNEIAAEPLTKETVARSGDVFTVGFKVTNHASKEIVTRIAHRIEPKELAQYLDLVECALLLPVHIRPGETQTYNSTYMVRGDLPDGAKAIKVTYEFKIENK